MSWSYSGNPSNSQLDEVRFLIGDTDSTEPLLTDEELSYLITVDPDQGSSYSNYTAAAAAARAIAAKFSKQVDKTVGSLSIAYGRKASQFFTLADGLEARASKGTGQRRMGVPILGGGGEKFLMSDDWE